MRTRTDWPEMTTTYRGRTEKLGPQRRQDVAPMRASGLAPCPAFADLVFRDNHAEMEDAFFRIRVEPYAPAFRQDLVELDPHGPPTSEPRTDFKKRSGVVLGCDT